MKNNETAYETSFWAGDVAGNPFKVIKAFFHFAHLDYYKQNLSEVVTYSYKNEVYKQDNPSDVFILYTAFSSFIKVCFCLKDKSKKWMLKESLRSETVFRFSSLTKEEYDNPFIVFQKAFKEKPPEEFELFLRQITELSLSPHADDPGADLMTPYIYLIKMLDAVELMRERGVEKIKKKNLMDSVAT
ncbi:hypothetical protein KHA98_08360 [Flavobacterium branchiicola]|nr:hypothetical protein [Flavobacterium branchiicola]